MAIQETRETAAFNLAMPYLMRVNHILNNNLTEFRNGNSRAFAINLRQLYRELRPWLIVDDKKSIDETVEFKAKFKKLSLTPRTDIVKVWDILEDIEMDMRMYFKKLGMLMPRLNDPRFLFGNRQK